MVILGIETSCDDTCAAIVEASGGLSRPRFLVRSNVVSSQVKTHAPFGGVVPTLAAREHADNIAPVLRRAFRDARCTLQNVDLIAVTAHPGLLPALLVGVHAARALAWSAEKPILGINHLHGHVIANLLSEKSNLQFPAIGLIVSGGHTQLVLMRNLLTMKILGETRDDAAGEAFDKVAKLLGLPFPGGPPLAKLAERGDPTAFAFPRPMYNSSDFDFSFSGLKTAVLYAIRNLAPQRLDQKTKVDIAASFQQAVVDTLVAKTIRAAKQYHAKTVLLGGGVAANRELRRQLRATLARETPPIPCTLSPIPYAMDNGAMIAAAAYLSWQSMTEKQHRAATWQRVRVKI